MNKAKYRITTTEYELKEGLFGQIVLYVFEILPFLYSKSIFPEWDIKSTLYGTGPHYTVIPGVFDIAYEQQNGPVQTISLAKLREQQISVLGGDWQYLHELWHFYFKIPTRIINYANEIGDLSFSLGIHYRGNDKNKALWDTNPVAHDEYLTLTNDFIARHPDIKSIFVATDEYAFVEKIKQHFKSSEIINLGAVEFHKNSHNVPQKADRAVLDCLLLSRCKYLIMTSSALSGFTKVLNPNLECYRVSASKFFIDIPYFPVAYIPRLTSEDPECERILTKLFEGDWLENEKANRKFNNGFRTKKRYILPAGLRNTLYLPVRLKNSLINRIYKFVTSNN
jgi:hypothetical protein